MYPRQRSALAFLSEIATSNAQALSQKMAGGLLHEWKTVSQAQNNRGTKQTQSSFHSSFKECCQRVALSLGAKALVMRNSAAIASWTVFGVAV